jgi:hypothetical protein
MALPVVTKDVLDWLKVLCDIPAKSKDSPNILRWKAAQRDVYLRAKAVHESQLNPGAAQSKAEKLGYKIKSDQ